MTSAPSHEPRSPRERRVADGLDEIPVETLVDEVAKRFGVNPSVLGDLIDQAQQTTPLPDLDVQLTTTAAAAQLGISRPFLIKLLDQGVIPFHLTGTHRRIQLSAVKQYLSDRDALRDQRQRDLAGAIESDSSAPHPMASRRSAHAR